MNTMKALGMFINYCNGNMGRNHPEITNDFFQKGYQKILETPDDRFINCHTVSDILKKINFPNF